MTTMDAKVGRLEAWAIRCFERHFYVSLNLCTLAQTAIALVLAYFPIFHGTVVTWSLFHDVFEYYDYANRVFAGQVPYRDFMVEYPPLGMVLFLIPRLATSDYRTYAILSGLNMLFLNSVCLLLAVRWTAKRYGIDRVPRCIAWYSAFFIFCNPTAMARYDLAVMFFAFASSYWLLSGRPILGGANAAVAALLKVLPGVAAAPAFLRELLNIRSSKPRGIVTTALIFAVGVGAWFAVGGHGVFETIQYHNERGLETGSLYSGILALSAKLRGVELPTVFNHFAVHMETPVAMRLAMLAAYLQVGAFLLALWAYWRGGLRDGLRYSAACLLAFIVFGKVLSPQYLIWLIPFLACLEGRSGERAKKTYLTACLATFLIYPLVFIPLVQQALPAILLLNVRNLVLLVLFGRLVFDRPTSDEPASQDDPPADRLTGGDPGRP
jgi:hypothetical protein